MTTSTIRNVNDGSQRPPRLACYLNVATLMGLPAWSSFPARDADERRVLGAVREAGFEGVQGGSHLIARDLGLGFADGGRVNTPGRGEADTIAAQAKDRGAVAATLHVAWGLEDDATVDALVGEVIEASAKHDLPLYIETHRATITQDIWRTVELTHRFPGVRFNGDFSHWYTGLEMRYGGVEMKLDYARPVLDRVRFLHGRIGNGGSIQVDVGRTLDEALSRENVGHFVDMWTRAMAGFLRDAGPGDVLIFAPELLHAGIYYARAFPGPDGQPREESDRWQQSLLYMELARHCFAKAQEQVAAPVR